MPSEADYQRVADDITSLLKRPGYDDGHTGPLFVRLAWHACGTFCQKTRTGGSEGGTMRFYPEGSDPANNGLQHARAMLEPVKLKYPWISYGDLWTMAGAIAIEAMGGPSITWRPGRVDKNEERACPVQGRLPDATQGAEHLRQVFYRMGFDDREIVALSGAHTLGRCHKDRSGFIGPWTYTPTRFSNQYFILLFQVQWQPVKKYQDGPLQYKDDQDQLMMLPTDLVLIEDPSFKSYAQQYAKDKQAFFKDFAQAFSKLLALGVRQPGPVVKVSPKLSSSM